MVSFKKTHVFLLIFCLVPTVCCQQNILSADEISQDESFTVTCDGSRVTLPFDTQIISKLRIIRQVGSESESVIAQYKPTSNIPGDKEVKNIPFGRIWDITFTGGELVNGANKDRVRAVLRVNDTKCEDTGMYKCYVEYLDESFVGQNTEVVQNLTVKAAIEYHLLTAVPHNGNDLLYSLYPLGSNVTLTCRIQGPPGLTMTWQQQLATDLGFYDYGVMNDIVTKDPEPVPGGSANCVQHQYESTLRLVIEEQNQFTTSYPAMYQCVVRESSNTNIDVSKANITLGIDTSQTCCQQNILSADEISQDESFTVTCDGSRITLPFNTQIISTLRISRQVGSESESVIAQYKPLYNLPGGNEVRNIPFGRRWDITFTGGELVNDANKDRARAVLRVNDSKCEDTGMYKCYVEYPDENYVDQNMEVVQNLTVKAAIENHLLTAVPHNGNDLMYSLYPLGSNVTLTCRIQGPPGLTMTWQQQLANDLGFSNYPVMNDIVTKDPEPVPGSSTNCIQHQYESTLRLVIEEPNQLSTSYPAMYQCVVRESSNTNIDVSKANITLGIDTTQSSTNDPQPGASKAGSDDIGLIIGCVIGGLALIVIVILLIYCLVFRKRNKEDKYKDDGDSPDGTTNPDLHAPPPVFYSKPTKPPKDDRDNDTTRGGDERTSKPRYDDYEDKSGGYDRRPYYDNHYNDYNGSSGGRRGRKESKNSSSSHPDDNYPYANSKPHDGPHYASTDVSRSEDEFTDKSTAPLDGAKPRPKRRTKVMRDDDGRRDEKLHYADLDLAPRSGDRRDHRSGKHTNRRDKEPSVEYAEIRV